MKSIFYSTEFVAKQSGLETKQVEAIFETLGYWKCVPERVYARTIKPAIELYKTGKIGELQKAVQVTKTHNVLKEIFEENPVFEYAMEKMGEDYENLVNAFVTAGDIFIKYGYSEGLKVCKTLPDVFVEYLYNEDN